MIQQGQVFKLKARGADGRSLWAHRHRLDGRSSARPRVGGFASRGEAEEALRKALARLRPGGCAAVMQEIEAVAAQLGPVFGPMVIFAAASGLRPSELFGLEWRDVDHHAALSTCRARSRTPPEAGEDAA